MFNKIRGHLLICAITEALRLDAVNTPFYGRVSNDIIYLSPIVEKQDIFDLMNYLQSDILTNCSYSETELKNMAASISGAQKIASMSTRDLVKAIVSKMNKQKHFEGIQSYLEKNAELQLPYNESKSILEQDGSIENVAKSFFDPLYYYLMATGLSDGEPIIDRRDFQSFIDMQRNRALTFTFGKSENIKAKLQGVLDKYGLDEVVLFVDPYKGDVTYQKLEGLQDKVTIRDYAPEELLVLLEMFRTHIEVQEEVAELIHLYTNNNL
jgi:hypothetical protein